MLIITYKKIENIVLYFVAKKNHKERLKFWASHKNTPLIIMWNLRNDVSNKDFINFIPLPDFYCHAANFFVLIMIIVNNRASIKMLNLIYMRKL